MTAPRPLMHEIFRYWKFSETHKGSPAIFFRSVKQEISTENRDENLLCIKFFDTQK